MSKLTYCKQRASELNTSVPPSEQWFRSLYEAHMDKYDEYNAVIDGQFIGDVVNERYKYVIEIDGSAHDSAKQLAKDIRRDTKLTLLGYKVYRIKAYDEQMFKQVLEIISPLRHSFIPKSQTLRTLAVTE